MPIANCKRCRGLVDGTQRREEATDIEEEEEEEEAADSEEAVAERNAVSGAPAVATSPRSSLAEPPGFSPGRDGAGASFGALSQLPIIQVRHGLRVRAGAVACASP